MDNEITESAKAVQEVAKASKAGIEATQQLGGFVSRIINEPLENVVGILADRLKFMRAERQLRLVDRWREIMNKREIKGILRVVPPKLALPIVENASLEEEDELQDLWANLLASAVDPNFDGIVRTAFIDIIKQLEIIDVHILNFMYTTYIKERSSYSNPSPVNVLIVGRQIIDEMKLEQSIYENSIDNLIRLRCIVPWNNESYTMLAMTAFGISFMKACTEQSTFETTAQ